MMNFALILQLMIALLQSGLLGNVGASGGANVLGGLNPLGSLLGGTLGAAGPMPVDPTALTNTVTGLVTGILNGVHAGVQASTVTQLPGATVATGAHVGT